MGRRASFGIPIALAGAAALAFLWARRSPGVTADLPAGWERASSSEEGATRLLAGRALEAGGTASLVADLGLKRGRAEVAARAEALERDMAGDQSFAMDPVMAIEAGGFAGWGFSFVRLAAPDPVAHGRFDTSQAASSVPGAPRLIRSTEIDGAVDGVPLHVVFEAPAGAYEALRPQFDGILASLRPPARQVAQ